MKKKFISLLGTTTYSECVYYIGDKKSKTTPFIQEALIELLCEDWSEDDKAIVLLTEDAKAKNWLNSDSSAMKLKDRLLFRDFGIQIISEDIKDSKNIEEIWCVFDSILNVLDDGDEVIFDITNSFRSIPMLALTVLNYAKVLKNIKIKGIYYGAFDHIDYKNGNIEFPIIDITSLDEILEWSQAIGSFLKYGNGEHIKDMSKSILNQRIINGDKEARDMRVFIDSLNHFTNCINTCRGKFIDDKRYTNYRNSIQSSYSKLDEDIEVIVNNNNEAIKPLRPLVGSIKNKIEGFKEKTNMATGMAVLEWSISSGLIQQGYTVLEETMNTYLCRVFELDETNARDRHEIISKSINIKARDIEEKDWSISKKYKDEEFEYIVSKITNILTEIDMDIIKLALKIKDNRNDINHLGFTPGKSKEYDKLKNELIEFKEEFLKLVETNSIDIYAEIAVGI